MDDKVIEVDGLDLKLVEGAVGKASASFHPEFISLSLRGGTGDKSLVGFERSWGEEWLFEHLEKDLVSLRWQIPERNLPREIVQRVRDIPSAGSVRISLVALKDGDPPPTSYRSCDGEYLLCSTTMELERLARYQVASNLDILVQDEKYVGFLVALPDEYLATVGKDCETTAGMELVHLYSLVCEERMDEIDDGRSKILEELRSYRSKLDRDSNSAMMAICSNVDDILEFFFQVNQI